jgi:hypothetical protein
MIAERASIALVRMTQAAKNLDQRQFPRVKAPIYYKSPRFRHLRQRVIDVSLGGVRIYSDTPLTIEQGLDLELFLPDSTTLRCRARVAWIAALPPGSPAKFDVGLQLVEVPPGGQERLARVLDAATGDLPYA